MRRKFTTLLSLATLFTMGAQAQDLSVFQNLPTETGKGIITTLRDNGMYVGVKKSPGYDRINSTWARYNQPNGGNGRVYVECRGQDPATGFYKYIIAGQGLYIAGFAEDTQHGDADGNATSMRPTVGPKAQAYEFLAEKEDVPDATTGVTKTVLRFKDPASGRYLFADNKNGNNMLALANTDPNGWEVGQWSGVSFARMDVKPYNGDATGGAIKPCYDGYYYGTLFLPFAIIVPNGNETDKYPNIRYGNKVVNIWKLGGYADDVQVTQANPGDTIPAATPILVRASDSKADFPFVPTSEYIDQPNTESFFTGYYTEAPVGEQFQLTIDDGYPKFERANVLVDKNNHTPGHEGQMYQAATDVGYIVANNDNDHILEYRFNFEDMTLKGYENPDYKSMLKATYEPLLKNAGSEPFGINPADTLALKQELEGLGDDISQDEYNAYIEKVNNSITQPDETYISIKQNQSLGDRGDQQRSGLFSNFNGPNGANSRFYFKKVADGQYQVGVNGRWIQAPKDGIDVDDPNTGTTVHETYQVDLGTEPVTFDVKVVAPGQITISKDDIAVATGGGDATVANDEITTNKSGIVIGAPLYTTDEEGQEIVNTAAIWTVNPGYTNTLTLNANEAAFNIDINDSTQVTRNLGTVCEPYAIVADKDSDPSAQLYKVLYDEDENLILKPVESLEAGEPGIISSTKNTGPKAKITGGYVTAPKTDGTNALIGILNTATMPVEGQYSNPHFLGVATNTTTVGEGDDAQDVTTQSLVFTESRGKYDINIAFIDFGSNADDVPFYDIKELVTGIKTINTNANIKKPANDAIYNLAGQRVGKDYKGIVIKNGKKYFNR